MGFLEINCFSFNYIPISLTLIYFGKYWWEEEANKGIKPSWKMAWIYSSIEYFWLVIKFLIHYIKRGMIHLLW